MGAPHAYRLYQRGIPLSAIILVAFWSGWAYFFRVHPPIGTYTGLLAFMAVVVTVWPPEWRWGKAAWIATFELLMILEVLNLYHDRSQHDAEQQAARDAFQSIVDGIRHSIAVSNTQFQATEQRMEGLITSSRQIEGLSNENLEQAKGGNSYMYFEIVGAVGLGPTEVEVPGIAKGYMFATAVPRLVGRFPLHNVFVAPFCPMGPLPSIDYGTVFPGEIGRPREGIYLQFPPTMPEQEITCVLLINASNGSYSQTIRFRRHDDKWTWASVLAKYGGGLRREFFGPGFPKN